MVIDPAMTFTVNAIGACILAVIFGPFRIILHHKIHELEPPILHETLHVNSSFLSNHFYQCPRLFTSSHGAVGGCCGDLGHGERNFGKMSISIVQFSSIDYSKHRSNSLSRVYNLHFLFCSILKHQKKSASPISSTIM